MGVDGQGGRSGNGGRVGLVGLLLLFPFVRSVLLVPLLLWVMSPVDLLGALVPSNRSGVIEEGLSEDDGLTSGHVETIGKCLVIKWCNSLLVDV